MIRVKLLARNEVVIIDNGKSYKFGVGGRCSGEDLGNLTGYMSGALDLPLISILSSNNKVNIGASFGGEDFKSYDTDLDAMKCALTLQASGGYLRMLRRDGKEGNIAFNQLIFVYKEGTDLVPYLSKLGYKEVL